MSPRVPFRRRLSRASLLLAALLHFLGAAAGPAAHVLPGGAARGPVAGAVVGTERHDTGAPSGHDEFGCMVCQALGAVAAPAAASALPVYEVREEPVLAESHQTHVSPRSASTRARAPPLPYV